MYVFILTMVFATGEPVFNQVKSFNTLESCNQHIDEYATNWSKEEDVEVKIKMVGSEKVLFIEKPGILSTDYWTLICKKPKPEPKN